jgi:type VI secretion system secreted protein VgrG
MSVGDLLPFELLLPGVPPFLVRELEGHEAFSTSFRYRVVGTTTASFTDLRAATLGARARLRKGKRWLEGLVTGLRLLGHPSEAGVPTTSVAVTFESPLSRLSTRSTSRIFQDRAAVAIAEELLGEWHVPTRVALGADPGVRHYAVQRSETDLDFLHRTLAEEGVFTFFEDPVGDAPPVLVLSDHAAVYRPDAARPPAVLRYAPESSGSAAADAVLELESDVTTRPRALLVRDYDPARAEYDLAAHVGLPARSAEAVRAATPHVYSYLPARPLTDDAKRYAARELDLARRDDESLRAVVTCPDLGPASTLVVLDHPEVLATQAWVVTALEDSYRQGPSGPTYRAELTCLPVERRFVPERLRAPRVEGMDLAVVVGPAGQTTDVDALGRVRVRFRWDDDRPDLERIAAAERHSCWLRVLSPWGGAGFGAQFVPRVGSEVLVGFLQGDVNRPIVLGSLATSSAPPIFPLPTGARTAGVAAVSEAGRSEITLDDTPEGERVNIVGARDVEVRAGRTLSTRVAGDRDELIAGSSRTVVAADERTEIEGSASRTITRDERVSVGAQRALDVQGASRTKVRGVTQLDLEGGLDARVAADTDATFEGPSRLRFEEEHVSLHRKDLVIQCGLEARAALAVGVSGTASVDVKQSLELSSESAVVLSCGESLIVLEPTGITLRAPRVRIETPALESVGDTINLEATRFVRASAERVLLLSSDASIAMGEEVKIRGQMIRLGAPPDAIDGPEAARGRPAPTRIELRDQAGQPFAFERFVVTRANGERRHGRLDELGQALVQDLEGSATIDFPGLPNFRKE